MTVANQTNRIAAVGNAAIGQEVPFSFPITATSDLLVKKRVTATGVETTLDETTNYTVEISGDIGGTLTTVTAIELTEQIHIIRNTPKTQSLDLEQGGSFNAENIEDALDKNTKLVIENKDAIGKAIIFPTTDAAGLTTELPNSIDRASKNLTFDSDGNVATSVSVEEGSVSFTTFGTNMAEAANALAGKAVMNLDHVFDVQDYGAVGNGSTDDLVAIQATVDACIATTTGGIVYFPRGKYSIDDGSITVTNGGNRSIWFVGAGMYASRIVKTTTGTGDLIIWNCTGNPSGIQNLGIVAAVGGNFGVDGISATAMNGVFLENVWMGGFENGFNLIGTDIHLTNCISEQNSSYGFVFDRMVKAINCKSYLNGYGYKLHYSTAPAYPDEPAVLVNCSDGESKNHALTIDSRDNVELIGFCTESSGWNGNVGIYITGSNQINIIGGNLRYLVDYGIQLVGACSNVTINGVKIQEIGQTTTGIGIQMVGGSTNTLVSNCLLKNIRLSAIKTGNSSGTRITNNVIHTFGRNETAGNKFGVLIDGDAATKGSTVSNNRFVLSGGDTQTGMVWESGAQGKFFIRENEYVGGTLMDLTNAPAGTIVENNQWENYQAAAHTTRYHIAGELVKNTSPSTGYPSGWECIVAGTPGIWKQKEFLGETVSYENDNVFYENELVKV